MGKQVSIAEARDNLPRLVHQAERGEAVELTRRGKPVAVILAAAEYQRLVEGISFWRALEAFRREAGLAELGIEEAVFPGTRDRSPGREVGL
jgi:prevent-host-death family protein